MRIYNISLSNRYNSVMKLSACRKRVGLAPTLYARPLHPPRSLNFDRQKEVHSVSKRVNDKTIKTSRLFIVAIALIAQLGPTTAHAKTYSVDHLKLYAHSRLLSYEQFQCFNWIITKESRWSYTAKNGSHYGLGQMRSKHYRDLDPYRQIDATIRYISIRYSNSCKAKAFHSSKGYY
jgi:hypothetical protein